MEVARYLPMAAVIIAGALAGAGFGAVVHPPGTGPSTLNDTPSLNVTSGPRSTTVKHITINSTTDWRRGKVQSETTEIAGGMLGMRDGETSVDYWESATFIASDVKGIRVYASIPEPGRSQGTVKLIASNQSDFGDTEGDYVRTGEQTYHLKDGWNSFTTGSFETQYHRVFFSLSRESASVPAPRIKNYTVWFQRRLIGARAER